MIRTQRWRPPGSGSGQLSDACEGFEYCAKRVKWSGNNRMVGLRKVNRDEEEATTNNGCTFYENMQMQCAWCYEMKCKTWTKCKTNDKKPTTEEITYRISGKGKSWSYEYGKLYPGCYNTPPLREDLVPRSRMAPERNGRGREEVKLSCFFDEWVKPWTLRGWAI